MATTGLGGATGSGWVVYPPENPCDFADLYGAFQLYLLIRAMSESMPNEAETLADDPVVLKAMIVALQVQNAKMSATLRAHDQLVQALQLRIARLQKQAFGASSEKIEREIEQLEFALEDLLVAVADTGPHDEDDTGASSSPAHPSSDPVSEEGQSKPRRRPVSRKLWVLPTTPRERRELDPGETCPDCGGRLRVVGEDVRRFRAWR